MKRWERVGLDPSSIPQLVKNAYEILPLLEDWSPELFQDRCRSSAVIEYHLLTCLRHLEVDGLPPEAGVGSAKRAADVAAEYFFGDWRKRFEYHGNYEPEILDVAGCRKKLEWFETYREGLLCASCIEDRTSLDALWKWPDCDLRYDEGTWDSPPEENEFHILMALAMRDEKPLEQAKLRDKIKAGRPMRAKLWFSGLDAILTGDSKAFVVALEELLTYNLKREFRPDNASLAILREGTILYHMARLSDLAFGSLPESIMDRIITKESLSGP